MIVEPAVKRLQSDGIESLGRSRPNRYSTRGPGLHTTSHSACITIKP